MLSTTVTRADISQRGLLNKSYRGEEMNDPLTFTLTRKRQCEEMHLCIAVSFPREAPHFVAVPEMRLTKHRHEIEIKLKKIEESNLRLRKTIKCMKFTEIK